MDNREFAKVLLSEATELLNEGAKYREKLKLRENEVVSDYGHTSKQFGELGANSLSLARKCENSFNNEKNKLKSTTNPEEIKVIKGNMALDSIGVNANIFNAERMAGSGKYIADKINKELAKKQKDDINPIHNKINERAKKSQNESIAILLTEAALLLNEDIFNKFKKTNNYEYQGGFEPDTVNIKRSEPDTVNIKRSEPDTVDILKKKINKSDN